MAAGTGALSIVNANEVVAVRPGKRPGDPSGEKRNEIV